MKERPILFSGEMVRAILDGRKTQTRRVVKPQPELLNLSDTNAPPYDKPHWCMYPDSPDGKKRSCWPEGEGPYFEHCPYGQVGDKLWVKESWGVMLEAKRGQLIEQPYFQANGRRPHDHKGKPLTWKSPRYMPRWASRLTLEITAIRVERLQAIHIADIEREGIDCGPWPKSKAPEKSARVRYHELWDSLNEKRGYGWEANPWVWVIEFGQASP